MGLEHRARSGDDMLAQGGLLGPCIMRAADGLKLWNIGFGLLGLAQGNGLIKTHNWLTSSGLKHYWRGLVQVQVNYSLGYGLLIPVGPGCL
jgi:hypothetical protein